jgi:large conductance mechanosensitive channel
MVKGFRDFILRGNVVDLAIAVVIGVAFKSVVDSLVKDFFTPLIGVLGVNGAFADQSFTVNKSVFLWGDFINSVISFLVVAAAVYFAVVAPMNHMAARRVKPEAELDTRECPYCITEIPKKATRCSACTAEVPAAA